jgi:hypothetical protein
MIRTTPMQDFVKTVQEESDQVASELQKVLANLEPLLQERRLLEQRAKALETVISTYVAGQDGSPALPSLSPEPQGRHFLDVAHDILKKEGPLYYETLLAKLGEAGITIPGRNPGANLIAHMSRDTRFTRTGRGTYSAKA